MASTNPSHCRRTPPFSRGAPVRTRPLRRHLRWTAQPCAPETIPATPPPNRPPVDLGLPAACVPPRSRLHANQCARPAAVRRIDVFCYRLIRVAAQRLRRAHLLPGSVRRCRRTAPCGASPPRSARTRNCGPRVRRRPPGRFFSPLDSGQPEVANRHRSAARPSDVSTRSRRAAALLATSRTLRGATLHRDVAGCNLVCNLDKIGH